MSVITATLQEVVDGYFAAVSWVDQNPQKTIWLGFAVVVLALAV